MNPDGALIEDFDGDGLFDFLMDEAYLDCSGTAAREKQSISCGAQVCAMRVWLWRDRGLVEVAEWQNSFAGTIPGDPMGLKITGHGGTSGVMRWNGSGFALQQAGPGSVPIAGGRRSGRDLARNADEAGARSRRPLWLREGRVRGSGSPGR